MEALFDRLPEPLIAVREIATGGRSTARLDDQATTASRLADEVGPLIEIHGQHDQQRLLDERWQRDLLDAFGGHGATRAAMAGIVERWRANRAALAELAIDPRELARRVDLLEHEAAEIARGTAASRRGRRDPRPAVGRPAWRGDRPGSGRGRGGADRRWRGRPRRDGAWRSARRAVWPASTPVSSRWPSGWRGSRRSSTTSRSRSAAWPMAVEHDPVALAALEERLGTIYALERRYGDGEAAVIAHGERAAAELERLGGLDAERARRERGGCGAARRGRRHGRRPFRPPGAAAGVALTAAVGDVAASTSASRPASSRSGSAGGWPLADEPAVELDGDAVAFDASGVDQVVYRLAPNPGEPARPLARIASGGELSRVALAIKSVLAEADDTPVLVFDEVDTGIGGRSADPVGRSLWALARRHQVLCVTHLPQIAAHADAQYRIVKRERDGRTVTEVEELDREGRIVELAQMLGGEAGGAATLASARELLDRAEALARRGRPGRLRPASRRARPRWRDRRLPDLPARRTRPGPGDDPRVSRRPARLRGVARRQPRMGHARPMPPSTTSRRGRVAAGVATPGSPRAACVDGPPRSRASTASRTAKGSSAWTWPPTSTCPARSGSCPRP